jgi:hypothetical protein
VMLHLRKLATSMSFFCVRYSSTAVRCHNPDRPGLACFGHVETHQSSPPHGSSGYQHIPKISPRSSQNVALTQWKLPEVAHRLDAKARFRSELSATRTLVIHGAVTPVMPLPLTDIGMEVGKIPDHVSGTDK